MADSFWHDDLWGAPVAAPFEKFAPLGLDDYSDAGLSRDPYSLDPYAPAPSARALVPPPPKRSRGGGRCGATPRVNGRRTPAKNLTHTVTGPDGQPRQILLTKSAMRALEGEFAAAGLNWDHQVTTTGPGGEELVHYADSSTIRGGLPLDTPEEVRTWVRDYCAEERVYGKDSDTISEERGRVIAALQAAGYPAVGSTAFRDAIASANPLADTTYAPATPLELAYVRSTPLYPRALDSFLEAGGSVQVKVNAHGGIVTVLAGGQVIFGTTDFYSLAPTQSYALVPESLRCFSCSVPRGMCKCGSGVSRRAELENRLRDPWESARLDTEPDMNAWGGITTPEEHRWGRDWAVRPSLTDHARASASRAEVEALMSDALGSFCVGCTRAELGEEIAYDVALLCVQTNSSPAELLTPHTSKAIIDGLRQADVVVQRFHPRHGHILHQTFDTVPAPRSADGKASRTEVYLGRDGVYMYEARMEQQRLLRRHGMGTESDVRYVTISRGAYWNAARDDHLLGDGKPEFVDTGFSGSIVSGILNERKRAGTGGADGQLADHTKLYSSRQRPLMAEGIRDIGGMSSTAAYAIEHGPKPHTSVSQVGGLERPTGAVEQLMFRQTLRSIRREVRKDSDEIVQGVRPAALLGTADAGQPYLATGASAKQGSGGYASFAQDSSDPYDGHNPHSIAGMEAKERYDAKVLAAAASAAAHAQAKATAAAALRASDPYNGHSPGSIAGIMAKEEYDAKALADAASAAEKAALFSTDQPSPWSDMFAQPAPLSPQAAGDVLPEKESSGWKKLKGWFAGSSA